MFVRKLKHKNGRIYIQAVEKVNKKYVVKHPASVILEIKAQNELVSKAEEWIQKLQGLFKSWILKAERLLYQNFYLPSPPDGGHRLSSRQIFDEIGFNRVR